VLFVFSAQTYTHNLRLGGGAMSKAYAEMLHAVSHTVVNTQPPFLGAFCSTTESPKTMKPLSLVLLFASLASLSFAHSGGTNAYGCHYNHKTGVYHCH
jgi:hypothetical protein